MLSMRVPWINIRTMRQILGGLQTMKRNPKWLRASFYSDTMMDGVRVGNSLGMKLEDGILYPVIEVISERIFETILVLAKRRK